MAAWRVATIDVRDEVVPKELHDVGVPHARVNQEPPCLAIHRDTVDEANGLVKRLRDLVVAEQSQLLVRAPPHVGAPLVLNHAVEGVGQPGHNEHDVVALA